MSNRSKIKRLIKELSTNPDLDDDIIETLDKWEEEDERKPRPKRESDKTTTDESIRRHRRGKGEGRQ